jgi:hypothetical protein
MARKKSKPRPMAPTEPRKLSHEMQANMERLVESLGYLILKQINPEAAKLLKSGC